MNTSLNIAFFGSSLASASWNGATIYYRSIIRALAGRGHRITFYEPDAHKRHKHRDLSDPDWAQVFVYKPAPEGVWQAIAHAAAADIWVKAGAIGVFDDLLEAAIPQVKRAGALAVYWDVDPPATLTRIDADPQHPMRHLLPTYDLIFTYGGGQPVAEAFNRLGAPVCVPIYNALDPSTHYPVTTDPRFAGDLAFLGNRLPDREARVERFFFNAAKRLPDRHFLLGGNGWQGKPLPENVDVLGHVYIRDHNAFNCTPLAVLNITREATANNGWSPATRIFEAAGAGACLISDDWPGLEDFLEPGTEILVASGGEEVVAHLESLDTARARAIGEAARRRVAAEHTYERRALQVESVLTGFGAGLRATGT